MWSKIGKLVGSNYDRFKYYMRVQAHKEKTIQIKTCQIKEIKQILKWTQYWQVSQYVQLSFHTLLYSIRSLTLSTAVKIDRSYIMNTINVICTLIRRSLGIFPVVDSKLCYRKPAAWPEEKCLILALMHKTHPTYKLSF